MEKYRNGRPKIIRPYKNLRILPHRGHIRPALRVTAKNTPKPKDPSLIQDQDHTPYTPPASRPYQTQADRVFAKFGGAMRLLAALQAVGKPRSRSVVYKWNHPKSRGGTGGIIPSSAWPDVLLAARCEGVVITGEEFSTEIIMREKR